MAGSVGLREGGAHGYGSANCVTVHKGAGRAGWYRVPVVCSRDHSRQCPDKHLDGYARLAVRTSVGGCFAARHAWGTGSGQLETPGLCRRRKHGTMVTAGAGTRRVSMCPEWTRYGTQLAARLRCCVWAVHAFVATRYPGEVAAAGIGLHDLRPSGGLLELLSDR